MVHSEWQQFTVWRGIGTFDVMSSSSEHSKREAYACRTAIKWWGEDAHAISTMTCSSWTPFLLDFKAPFASLASLSEGSYVHKITAFYESTDNQQSISSIGKPINVFLIVHFKQPN